MTPPNIAREIHARSDDLPSTTAALAALPASTATPSEALRPSLARYRNKWVALRAEKVEAVAMTLDAVLAEIEAKGLQGDNIVVRFIENRRRRVAV